MKTPVLPSINTRALLSFFLLMTISLIGCNKDDKTNPKPIQTAVAGPYLYIGGSLNGKAVVWKKSITQTGANPVADTFANANVINSIIISGTDVYMVGQTGGYWKNSSFIPVTGALSIQYIALSGNSVFAAGTDQSANIAYWVNNTEFNLQGTVGRSLFPNQGVSSLGVSGIAVSGSQTLVTGSLFTENEPGSPNTLNGSFGLLWTNSGVQLLNKGGFLTTVVYNSTAGVAVSGSDVYIAGRLPDSTYAGGYWKNGIFTSINNGAFEPSAIANFGADVYIAGYTFVRTPSVFSQQGAYWKNGTLVNVLNASSTTAVASNATDTYILGIDHNNNNVIWKNGVVFATLGSAFAQTAKCIAIGN